jgi:transposase InsO family protein
MIILLLHLIRLLPFLFGGHRQLALENLALREQLAVYKRTAIRPKLRTTDHVFWVGLARFWAEWRQPLVIVTPDTVLRWQRRRFREYWIKLSGRSTGGRPTVDTEIKTLITRMATANPLWGAPRIHGELLKLGLDVAERTVSRLMPKRRTRPSQTWRAFLDNHVRDLVAFDFFTVPTAGLRVLFVLVVLAHHRRRVVHFNVTEHPTAHWTAQQIVDAFPDDSAPSYLLRDRDHIYGEQFRRRVKSMRIEEVLSAPHSPWQNPFAERLIGSIRRECLLAIPASCASCWSLAGRFLGACYPKISSSWAAKMARSWHVGNTVVPVLDEERRACAEPEDGAAVRQRVQGVGAHPVDGGAPGQHRRPQSTVRRVSSIPV